MMEGIVVNIGGGGNNTDLQQSYRQQQQQQQQQQAPASPNSTLSSEAQKMLNSFWQKETIAIENMSHNDFRNPELPLARIKKIMKLDEDVKMISGEAPVLFAKAVEIFIAELSLRAWVNTEDNKRRTLQRNDISAGIAKNDQFDFLIDIVPREETKPTIKRPDHFVAGAAAASSSNIISQDQLNYFIQMAQQQQPQHHQQHHHTAAAHQPIQIIHQANAPNQASFAIASPAMFQLGSTTANADQQQQQQQQVTIDAQQQQQQQQQAQNGTPNSGGGDKTQSLILASNTASLAYNANGEPIVAPLPITLSSQQYQQLLQGQSAAANQPIIISTNAHHHQQLSAQFITNTGQVVQAIIPSSATAINAATAQLSVPQSSSSSSGAGNNKEQNQVIGENVEHHA